MKASRFFPLVGCLAGILSSISITVPSAVAGTFSTGFESFSPPGTALFGSAFEDSTGGVNGSGVLKLTTAANGLMGSFVIREIEGSPAVGPFTATFKMLIGGGNGADGLSFNFASDLPEDIFGEEGAGTGLTVSFDTFDNGGGEAPAIDVKAGGVVVGAVPGSAVFRTGDFVDVLIQVAANGTLDVTVNGTAIFDDLPVTLDLSSSGRFGFGARTGGLNDNHFIDDLTITTGSPSHPVVTSSSPRGNNVRPDAIANITIQEFETEVNPASIQLRFDGTLVTPQISKAGDVATIQYDPPGLLPAGSSHAVSLTYSDNGSPVFTETITYNFTVADSGPNGNFYEVVLVPTGITWPEAKAAADARTYNGVKGHLATITSAEEDARLEQLRQQNRPAIGMGQLWVGGSQTVPDAPPTLDWFWENDEGPIAGFNGGDTYANWLPGEPNDYWGPATENYLAIGLNDAFGWNDDGSLDGGRLGGYIVEFETGSGGTKPVVDLTAIRWITGEPCPTCFVLPAIIRVSRSGPTNDSLTVHLAEGGGTATPTVDYPPVPTSVTIPAGSGSVEVPFLALDDQLVEGPEVARIRVVPSPDYAIQSFGNEVLITIQDDEPNAPTARLDIIAPTNGAHFLLGRTIELSALAVNANNEVYGPVEFYAGDQLVARSPVNATTRPALPGLASIHTAYWTNPPSGPHTLTARTQISFDTWISSPPVNITIQSPPDPVVRLETLPPQNAQAPEFCPLNADCAYPSFVVRRSGPTNSALLVNLSYSGTAAPGADYPHLPSSVIIPAGRDAAFLMLVPTDDSLVEGPETVVARFTPTPGATYFEDPSASSATITIIDNDTAPPQNVVSIFAEDPIATEAGDISIPEIQPDHARFRISRTGDLTREVRVFFSVSGSATHLQDYSMLAPGIAPPTSVVIPAGSNSTVIRIAAREDNSVEGMETVLMRLEHSPLLGPLPTYEINRAQDHGVAGIFDQGERRPDVEIVAPREGDHFQLPTSIDIIFAAFHPTEFVTGADVYAGSQKIGEVRFPIPVPLDGPPFDFAVHRFTWSQPPAGTHSLTVRAMQGAQTVFATSAPVNITVGGELPLPVVRIETVSPIAEEDTGPLDRLPLRGAFRITRDGPTTNALRVSVIYQGTATPGSDYETLPMLVTIPAGTNSALLVVSAIPDDLPEGIETVVARLFDCFLVGAPIPCDRFRIDPNHASATVLIVDDPSTEAGLAITRPVNGAVFDPGQTILIDAVAIDLESYISRVEFWDGENRIGVSEIIFVVPPDPGTPIHHTFQWNAASHGPHVLTARATRTDGTELKSAPVSITVRGDPPPPGLRIDATSPVAEESSVPFRRLPLVGVFTVSRTGPTNEAISAFVHYSGTATQGVDYAPQGFMVAIPAGASSTEIRIVATPDDLPEGIETVVATLSDCPPATNPPMGIPCFFVPIDPAHSRATVFIREDGITDATVNIRRPTHNASFNPGQTIVIEAVAIDLNGYIPYVEFFAGDQRIGVSNIQFVQPPPNGTPITHRFEWRNAPVGTHVLTARAPRSNADLIISPPVNITVRGEPPGDRELHVVGAYSGTAPDGGTSRNNEQGDAAVVVNRPDKRVTLVLSAYEPVLWHLTVGNATVVERIILGGYYAQKVEGVGTEVEIIDATFPNNPGNHLYVGYSLDCPDVYRAFEKIRAMTGLGISSFHGGYQAPYPTPTVIDSVQDDPRLRADYPVPTPASQLPNLQFQLSFYHRGSSGEVFTRRYTLTGPQEDSRLLPATRVIRDGGTRYYYGLNSHDPFRVDTQTGAEQNFQPPAGLPELSWPSGLTYDPERNRMLLVSFGGDGYLYGYAPNTEQWSLVRDMDNRDVKNLEYHAAGDALYGLSVFGGDCSSAWVMKFTSDGEFQSQFRINLHAYGSGGQHSTELVSVGEYLVLLLEPTHPLYEQSESRIYLIDPRTGESWLTYRSRGGNPANQSPQIIITRPASGAEFPADTETIDLDASAHDPDGYVRRVEFFANGLKIGETSMDFILPPPPGQSQTFSFTWRDPAPGAHVLTARAIDDDGASAISQGVPIRVGASNAPAVITVYAPDSYAVEPSASATPVLDTATFRITRSGSTNGPLTVVYRLYGTAQNGVDYQSINAWVVIPAGRRSATVTVSPLADNLAEGIESIVLELIPPPPIALDPSEMYILGSQRQAAAVINDPESPGAAPAASCTPVSGGLHLSFKATSGNYRIEASTDLINWETISTTAAVNDTVHFVETDRASFPRRFYRIVPEPLPLASD